MTAGEWADKPEASAAVLVMAGIGGMLTFFGLSFGLVAAVGEPGFLPVCLVTCANRRFALPAGICIEERAAERVAEGGGEGPGVGEMRVLRHPEQEASHEVRVVWGESVALPCSQWRDLTVRMDSEIIRAEDRLMNCSIARSILSRMDSEIIRAEDRAHRSFSDGRCAAMLSPRQRHKYLAVRLDRR
jgi:hypothetical protein